MGSLANSARLFGEGADNVATMPPPQSAKADFPKFQPPVSTGGHIQPAEISIPRM